MTQQPWSELVAQHVAKQLRRHRELRGLSAQELADRCASLGMPIQRSVIANFENGRRSSIGVAEVLVFAAALKMPPMWLITGAGYEESMEYLPGERADPYACAAWFYGTQAPDKEVGEYEENPMPYFDDLNFDVDSLIHALEKVKEIEARVVGEEPRMAELRERMIQLERDFEKHADLSDAAVSAIHQRIDQGSSSDAPELSEAIKESREAIKRLTVLREEIKRISEEQSENDASFELEAYKGYVAEAETHVRESIAAIRDRGWLLPVLPEAVRYLAQADERRVKRVGRSRPPAGSQSP
ncbi:helix-turn-helix domain-containing protein [Streptomyces sp. H27-H5]|uniref:helix-turn-helix domain-containing protein n=1 Tax=Streptomyces sp. H27-H5 TaxID=2996460 RepID=UPI00227138A9|nr:helix-turn-helix domain-containing protein [Streptomyces sp. H27-H5]MCY0961537.1 helix-turn-helix domain-containing protein [Streptomyces sp. H27-H5]